MMELHFPRLRDSRLVWEWANDPETRRQSFSSEPIEWSEHEHWYAIQTGLRIAWVPVGSVRIDDGEISVNVAPEQRGRGYGTELIRKATVTPTLARIKEGNVASLHAFKSAGYKEIARHDGIVEMIYSSTAI